MNTLYFFSACFLSFLMIIYATEPASSDSLGKDKALELLVTAEHLLLKAIDSLPTCRKNESESDRMAPKSYIEISKKLISNVREYFPTCTKESIQCEKPRYCSEILACEHKDSGIYTIWPWEPFIPGKPLQVYCDMLTDDGGWTVIQRRGKFPVQQDFHQDYISYKNGFGNLSQEFWLGNENIQALCRKECKIRFDLKDKNGEKVFAVYEYFSLLSNNYTLHIGGYNGNAGDTMELQNQTDFSTKDKGDIGIAEKCQGGWWYNETNFLSSLNGIYQQPGTFTVDGIRWWYWLGFENLDSTEIKIKPK